MWIVRIAIISGGLAEVIERQLKRLSEQCLARWYGLMRHRIIFFISIRTHLRSHRTRICAKLSGDISKDIAHVPLEWPYPLRNRKSR